MRVLDIDLDFFLSRIAISVDPNDRLKEADGFVPWRELEVRRFLEENCGLDKNKPIKGLLSVRHNEVFKHWRRLISSDELKTPFEVVHIDAHADLGLGDSGWSYILGSLLHKPVHERFFPQEDAWSGLGEGNYLAYALACRWIGRLTYVHHPDCNDDFIPYYFKDFDENSGFLQLPKYDISLLDNPFFYKEERPLGLEPLVPFEVIDGSKYQADSMFSYVFLTQSPSYTPLSSDKLIPIIMEYIQD